MPEENVEGTKSKKKLIVIIVVAALLLIGGGEQCHTVYCDAECFYF